MPVVARLYDPLTIGRHARNPADMMSPDNDGPDTRSSSVRPYPRPVASEVERRVSDAGDHAHVPAAPSTGPTAERVPHGSMSDARGNLLGAAKERAGLLGLHSAAYVATVAVMLMDVVLVYVVMRVVPDVFMVMLGLSGVH